ncbi:hypothetical protein ML401_23755 [Bradyrhizobium sp. 62B]|uniref:hypothetical protein n=1 Tax=Bradyrhizobium sp. 62B TaxID=2898442 RepID=UPI002557F799|nr:hypothetical protein ML401_23755 [Bradyrhizobium sp. 62B]
MTALTRRRSANSHQESWAIYFGDVRIGQIGMRAGVPTSAQQWAWSLGFYPSTDIGNRSHGTADTFELARDAFDRAWTELAPTITEADYDRWREERDFTAWKQRMWDMKLPLPTQASDGHARCFCGDAIDISGMHAHVDKGG